MKNISERDELLYESKYISVLKRDDWYEYIHNRQGNGEAVMVLVYDLSDMSYPQILGRYEHTPCHTEGYNPHKDQESPKPLYLTSITGQMDKEGKSHAQVALEELSEEAGISAQVEDLEDLGYVYPSKMSDTKIRMFAYDGHGSGLGEVTGDGTRGEEGAFVKWENAIRVIDNANCPLIGMAYLRLLNKKVSESFLK